MKVFQVSLRLNMQSYREELVLLSRNFLPPLSPSSYLLPSRSCHSQVFRAFLKAWLVLMNRNTEGGVNCPVYDCFCYLAGGRHDEN